MPDVQQFGPQTLGRKAIQFRNRTRPPGSLRDRLLAMAKAARQQACSEGEVREVILRKAEQIERTAAMEEWILSPGEPPPE
jgi:hypothetical protein